MQTNVILLYYNALLFVCCIPLLVALIVFYLFTGLAMLVVALIPGKVGPNAYGPDPKPAPTYEGYGQI